MSYYATGNGWLYLKEPLPDDVFDKLCSLFADATIYKKEIAFNTFSKYYEDDVYDLFNLMVPYVDSGEVEFVGEDDHSWKFVFKNGQLIEKNDRVVYENKLSEEELNEITGQIIDQIEDILSIDNRILIQGDKYYHIKQAIISTLANWHLVE